MPEDLRFDLVTSRAVGRPEAWIPLLRSRLHQGSRVALFQSETTAAVSEFEVTERHQLHRGDANYLVVLQMFHVEHR